MRVLALRVSSYGQAGEPAPVHPHLFRHARVRQIVRTTKSLPIAQKQAGWSRLQMAYLSCGRRRGPSGNASGRRLGPPAVSSSQRLPQCAQRRQLASRQSPRQVRTDHFVMRRT